MSYNTVLVKGARDRKKEAAAGGAITPGHLIERNSAGAVVVHATSGGAAARLFALENDLIGDGIDDDYASGDNVLLHAAIPGDEIYALIKDGQTVAIGNKLVSNGDGTLIVASTSNQAGKMVIGFPISLPLVTAGDVVTDILLGFAGTIEKVFWVQGTPVTTASKNADLVVDVGATELTGGLVDLDLDAIALGTVVDGSAVTANNTFGATDVISVRGEDVATFAEGDGTLFLVITPTPVTGLAASAVVAQALEAVSPSGADGRCLVEVM